MTTLHLIAGTTWAAGFLISIKRYEGYLFKIRHKTRPNGSSVFGEAQEFLDRMCKEYPEEYAAFMARKRLGIVAARNN